MPRARPGRDLHQIGDLLMDPGHWSPLGEKPSDESRAKGHSTDELSEPRRPERRLPEISLEEVHSSQANFDGPLIDAIVEGDQIRAFSGREQLRQQVDFVV